jgi:ribosomal subunit interface protein
MASILLYIPLGPLPLRAGGHTKERKFSGRFAGKKEGNGMRAIVKGRHIALNDDLKAYVEAKIQRPASKYFDRPSVILEVELADLFGPKGGQDKQCEVIMALPRGNLLRIEEVSDEIYAAIDAASDRLVRCLERYKGKKLVGGRYPKKYYVAKRLNAGEPPEART